jgi:hypothetical protein
MGTYITRDKDQLINQVASLDFFDIRQNIITFLQSQPQFTDFNFAGSNLSVLIDILAYYTFIKGFYLNAHMSEMFLTTAVQRTAVVARAKQIGYVPTSVRSASANLQVHLSPNPLPSGPYGTVSYPAQISIPAQTAFTVQYGSQRYTFTTLQAFSAIASFFNGYVTAPGGGVGVLYLNASTLVGSISGKIVCSVIPNV